jgi:deoxyribodipyrimidine photo-lyase
MLECLAELRERLNENLVVRHGRPERELVALAREAGARELHFTADSGPSLGGAWPECGGRWSAPASISPFFRAWLELPRREVLGRPRSIPALRPGLRTGAIPSLAELGLEQEIDEPMPAAKAANTSRSSGRDYLAPIVDHHRARKEAFERYRV